MPNNRPPSELARPPKGTPLNSYREKGNHMAKTPRKKSDSTATIGFEAKLWLTADKLRNNMDAAEYKHVVLGLIFLKYISDTFEEHRAKLLAGQGDYAGANAEDPDEYKAENVFWVPAEARWSHLQASAKQPTIGKIVDDAMVAIERDNPRLKGVPPKGNANFAWVQHFIHHLAPQGMAGFVLANGSMSSNQSGEGDIRRALIEADLVDCMVALPCQPQHSIQIPVCLWFIWKNEIAGKYLAASDLLALAV
jgi:type I restriction-modification system DNA methylase subunit